MKVLMSVYACEPGKSSEPAVGWNWALQAARNHDVWVVTRESNREAIEAHLAVEPVANLHFVYHDLPATARFWKRGERGLHLYYVLWQLTALGKVRELHRRVRFDAGHHVTFVSHRFPSFLAWLDLPYVWGPLAGADHASASFYRSFGFGARLKQSLRDLSNELVRFDPLVRRTAHRARTIIAATPATAALMARHWHRPVRTEPAIGWSGTIPEGSLPDGPLRAVFVGRLIYGKGVHVALEAIARARERLTGMTFTVVGEGPERGRLEEQARRLGIDDAVHFTGEVPSQQIDGVLSQHNCFVFPSFQDSGGFAVIEAMAQRLPVVALASGGPTILLDDEAGVLVSVKDPRQTVDELADAFVRLHADPALRGRIGDTGARRLRERFSWDRLADELNALYAGCIEEDAVRGTRPSAEAVVIDA